MIYIYNRDGVQIDHLDVKPIITEEIGKLRTLEFECEKEYEKGFRVVAEIEEKPYEFIIIDSDYSRDNLVSYEYYCQDSLIELSTFPILDKRPEGDVEAALTSILENTGWVNEVISTTNTTKNSFYHVTVFEAFSKVMETYRTEWRTEYKWIGSRITERRIVVYVRDGISKGRLEFGKNILNFKRTILSEPIITAIYPYGKGEQLENGSYGRRISIEDVNNGVAYIENEEATNLYGFGEDKKPLFGFLTLDDVEDKHELLRLAQEELAIVSQPRAEYEVSAIDFDIEAKIGWEVPVIDDEIGYRSNARIIKIVREGDDIKLTFGTVTKKFIDKFESSIRQTEKSLEDVYIQLNYIRSGADGKTNVFSGPATPTDANQGDIWYRENADGTVDLLRFNNGQWEEISSDRVLEELRAEIAANTEKVNAAQAQADERYAELNTKIDNFEVPALEELRDDLSILVDDKFDPTNPENILDQIKSELGQHIYVAYAKDIGVTQKEEIIEPEPVEDTYGLIERIFELTGQGAVPFTREQWEQMPQKEHSRGYILDKNGWYDILASDQSTYIETVYEDGVYLSNTHYFDVDKASPTNRVLVGVLTTEPMYGLLGRISVDVPYYEGFSRTKQPTSTYIGYSLKDSDDPTDYTWVELDAADQEARDAIQSILNKNYDGQFASVRESLGLTNSNLQDIDNRVYEVQSQADGTKSTVNQLVGKVSENESSISQVEQTMDGYSSIIATLRADVNGKLNIDEYNTFKQTAEGNFMQIGERLDSQGTAITTIEQTAQGLETKIESIKFGGDNLLVDSGEAVMLTLQPVSYEISDPLLADGELVTVVVKFLSPSNVTLELYHVDEKQDVVITSSDIDEYNRVVKTFNWKLGADNTSSNLVLKQAGQPVFAAIAWIKLVRGNNTVLEWSPSSKDFTTVQEYNTFKQTAERNFSTIKSIQTDLESGATAQKIHTLEERAGSTEEKLIQFDQDLDGKVSNVEFNNSLTTIDGRFTTIGKEIDGKISTAEYEQSINGFNATIQSIRSDITALASGGRNFISQKELEPYFATLDTSEYPNAGKVIVSDRVNSNGGIRLKIAQKLLPNTDYILTFKYTKLSGTLVSFGGHTDIAYQANTVTVDGVQKADPWGVAASGFVADDTLTHTVEVRFKTPASVVSTNLLYIQPNRLNSTAVEVRIEDLQLREGSNVLPWIQAPEDVITRSELSQFSVDLNEIKGTVETHSEELSSINTWQQTATESLGKIQTIENDITAINAWKITAQGEVSKIARIDADINNLYAGGVNILTGGKGDKLDGWTAWNPSTMSVDGDAIKLVADSRNVGANTPFIKIEKDKSYTVTLDIKANANLSSMNYLYVMSTANGNKRIPNRTVNLVADTWKRIHFTFKAEYTDENARVLIATPISLGANTLWLKNVKIAEGTIPSDYTMSEQELMESNQLQAINIFERTADMSVSELISSVNDAKSTATQTAEKISTMVTQNEFTTYQQQTAKKFESYVTNGDFGTYKTQTAEEIKSYVKKDNLVSEISQKAGDIFMYSTDGTRIERLHLTPEGTMIDTGIIRTAHIADAAITDAKIGNVSADKITAGTIDAKEVNLVNLNANNIISGTVSGTRMSINLNTSHITTWDSDRSHVSNMNNGSITLQNNDNSTRMTLIDTGITFHRDSTRKGFLEVSSTDAVGGVALGHQETSYLSIVGRVKATGETATYVHFDVNNNLTEIENYPIKFMTSTLFTDYTRFSKNANFLTNATTWQRHYIGNDFRYVIKRLSGYGGVSDRIIFIGNDNTNNGLGINENGEIWSIRNGAYYQKLGG